MKTRVLALAATMALALGQSNAQTITDTDGDGVYSLQELRAAFPDLTEKDFVAADRNGDGSIDMKELAVAVETGRISG